MGRWGCMYVDDELVQGWDDKVNDAKEWESTAKLQGWLCACFYWY